VTHRYAYPSHPNGDFVVTVVGRRVVFTAVVGGRVVFMAVVSGRVDVICAVVGGEVPGSSDAVGGGELSVG